jgi:hypothetical protein
MSHAARLTASWLLQGGLEQALDEPIAFKDLREQALRRCQLSGLLQLLSRLEPAIALVRLPIYSLWRPSLE